MAAFAAPTWPARVSGFEVFAPAEVLGIVMLLHCVVGVSANTGVIEPRAMLLTKIPATATEAAIRRWMERFIIPPELFLRPGFGRTSTLACAGPGGCRPGGPLRG